MRSSQTLFEVAPASSPEINKVQPLFLWKITFHVISGFRERGKNWSCFFKIWINFIAPGWRGHGLSSHTSSYLSLMESWKIQISKPQPCIMFIRINPLIHNPRTFHQVRCSKQEGKKKDFKQIFQIIVVTVDSLTGKKDFGFRLLQARDIRLLLHSNNSPKVSSYAFY